MTIISQSIFKASLNTWKPLADIPNQSGFQFIGHRRDGLQIVYTVRKVKGMFTVGTIFTELTAWRRLTAADKEAIANAE